MYVSWTDIFNSKKMCISLSAFHFQSSINFQIISYFTDCYNIMYKNYRSTKYEISIISTMFFLFLNKKPVFRTLHMLMTEVPSTISINSTTCSKKIT